MHLQDLIAVCAGLHRFDWRKHDREEVVKFQQGEYYVAPQQGGDYVGQRL